jgi:three-Cys-motif partner protein
MGEAKYVNAGDGHPARVAPPWTEEKLMILDAYLQAFANACRKAGGWYGLDLFAGGGLNWSEVRDREISGSPLIALEAEAPPASLVVASESDRTAHKALVARTARYGDRAKVLREDANEAIRGMLELVPTRAPAFAFLDPEGSELEWGTVEAIADHKRGASANKVEQLILFPTDMGFVRLGREYPEYVTRIFGHERWQEIERRRREGEIDADTARGEYVRLYAEGLKRLGYATVLDRQIKKPNGQPMYFLMFATDHAAGEKIMDHCFDQVRMRVAEELGQGTLFDQPSGPRRSRLDES